MSAAAATAGGARGVSHSVAARLDDEAIHLRYRVMDCFAEPVIGRAFARPGGSQ